MRKLRFFLILTMLLTGMLLVVWGASAQEDEPTGNSMHPTFPLLDENGNNVLDSGQPVSTMNTCGSCHDTAFIEKHSLHAQVGLTGMTGAGEVENGRVWDTSAGAFGSWNPLIYRYLSPEGDKRIDLTTAEWIQTYGLRHAGGGPAVYARNGERLTDLPADPTLENTIIDPETGEAIPWDWQQSGVEEMNCFLCHLSSPDNAARIAELEAGNFRWANTATLAGVGLVTKTDAGWTWNTSQFDEAGNVLPLAISDPKNENCGLCHGQVHNNAQIPLTSEVCDSAQYTTLTTGQVFSPQRLSNSGVNLEGKSSLSRSWDVHAERVVACTDCHYALNNPIYYEEASADRPDHLAFDPRRLDFSEYLNRPLHSFANSSSADATGAIVVNDTTQPCQSCHTLEENHDWLPYKDRHLSAVSCETCHIPQLYAPALKTVDWTALASADEPRTECRGVDEALVTGFEPVLLPRANGDSSVLSPYNLVSYWFWVYGEPARPVPLRDLQAVWFEGESYAADVLAVFDSNTDGSLSDDELLINTDEKEALIQSRLAARGLDNPRIVGEVQPYAIHHGVTQGDWATRDCDTCHTSDSRLNAPLLVAENLPGGVMPTFVSDGTVKISGDLLKKGSGKLYYEPDTSTDTIGLYILGHDSVWWIDWLGFLLLLAVFAAVLGHGGLRYLAARKMTPHEPELKRVYMYSIYERQWHWLQTAVIFVLLFTGLVIHKPDQFGMFSFRYVVQVHNIMAAILLINAALAAFYHLASGEIRQFLPRPHGFFDQAFSQARYYLSGIFKGEAHPMEKTPERKMNPLQQMTYLMILNVLLPLQVITGILMWGAQRWPDVAADLGGLLFLAPLHSLVAWLFASFVVAHVYLTTTAGHTPLAGIKSMMMGWDDVETHPTK